MGNAGFINKEESYIEGTNLEDYLMEWILVTTPRDRYSGKLIKICSETLLLLPYLAVNYQHGQPVYEIVGEGLPHRIPLKDVDIRPTSEESTASFCEYQNRLIKNQSQPNQDNK